MSAPRAPARRRRRSRSPARARGNDDLAGRRHTWNRSTPAIARSWVRMYSRSPQADDESLCIARELRWADVEAEEEEQGTMPHPRRSPGVRPRARCRAADARVGPGAAAPMSRPQRRPGLSWRRDAHGGGGRPRARWLTAASVLPRPCAAPFGRGRTQRRSARRPRHPVRNLEGPDDQRLPGPPDRGRSCDSSASLEVHVDELGRLAPAGPLGDESRSDQPSVEQACARSLSRGRASTPVSGRAWGGTPKAWRKRRRPAWTLEEHEEVDAARNSARGGAGQAGDAEPRPAEGGGAGHSGPWSGGVPALTTCTGASVRRSSTGPLRPSSACRPRTSAPRRRCRW